MPPDLPLLRPPLYTGSMTGLNNIQASHMAHMCKDDKGEQKLPIKVSNIWPSLHFFFSSTFQPISIQSTHSFINTGVHAVGFESFKFQQYLFLHHKTDNNTVLQTTTMALQTTNMALQTTNTALKTLHYPGSAQGSFSFRK